MQLIVNTSETGGEGGTMNAQQSLVDGRIACQRGVMEEQWLLRETIGRRRK